MQKPLAAAIEEIGIALKEKPDQAMTFNTSAPGAHYFPPLAAACHYEIPDPMTANRTSLFPGDRNCTLEIYEEQSSRPEENRLELTNDLRNMHKLLEPQS